MAAFNFTCKASRKTLSEEGWTRKPEGTAWFAANNNTQNTFACDNAVIQNKMGKLLPEAAHQEFLQ